MDFLGRNAEQKTPYELPIDLPTASNQVILSQPDNSLAWELLPASSNVQQLDIFDSEINLASWSQTEPASIAEFNLGWILRDSGAGNQGLWSVCPNTSTMIAGYKQTPSSGPIGSFLEFNLSGSDLNTTAIMHLHKTVNVQAFNEPYDQVKFEVFLGGFNSPEFEWDVFVFVGSVAKPDPVYDTDWAVTSGLLPQFTGVISGKMEKISIPLSQAAVCSAGLIQVVLQAKLASNGFNSTQYQTLPSRYCMSAQHARLFGLFTSSSLGTVIPVNQIDHNLILNAGINSHAALDSFKADIESKIDQSLLTTATPSFAGINLAGTQKWPSSDVSIRNQNNSQVLYTVNSTALSDRTIITGENVLSLSCQAAGGSIFNCNSISLDLRASDGVNPAPTLRISMKQAQTIMYDEAGVEKMRIDASGVIMADALQTMAIKPVSDATYDIGTPLLRYKDVHVSNTVIAQNFQIGIDANLADRKCVWMHFIAFQDLKADHVVKIVDHLGVAKINYVLAGDPDSTGVLGVTQEDILNGNVGKVCVGGIFKAVVQNGFTINIGDMLEKSDLGGNDGRFLSNPAAVASVGRMGVALSSATGNLLGTQFVYGTFLKNEAL